MYVAYCVYSFISLWFVYKTVVLSFILWYYTGYERPRKRYPGREIMIEPQKSQAAAP